MTRYNFKKKKPKRYLCFGERLSLEELSVKYKLTKTCIESRMQKGLSVEEAVSIPPKELKTVTYNGVQYDCHNFKVTFKLTDAQMTSYFYRTIEDFENKFTAFLERRDNPKTVADTKLQIGDRKYTEYATTRYRYN